MTNPNPPAPTPTPTPDAPPAPTTGPPDNGPAGGLQAVLADLAKERDERQKLQKTVEELAPLQRIAEALKGVDPNTGQTEAQILNDRLGQLETTLAAEQIARARAETVIEKKLSEPLAKLLAAFPGTSKEQFEAFADDLLAAYPAPDPNAPAPTGPPQVRADPAQGPRPEAQPNHWDEGKERAKRMFGTTPGT